MNVVILLYLVFVLFNNNLMNFLKLFTQFLRLVIDLWICLKSWALLHSFMNESIFIIYINSITTAGLQLKEIMLSAVIFLNFIIHTIFIIQYQFQIKVFFYILIVIVWFLILEGFTIAYMRNFNKVFRFLFLEMLNTLR